MVSKSLLLLNLTFISGGTINDDPVCGWQSRCAGFGGRGRWLAVASDVPYEFVGPGGRML